MATTTAKRRSLKELPPDELRAQIRKYEAALHGKEIDDALASSGALEAFNKATARLSTSVTKVQLLEELGRQAGIPRLVVSQQAPKPRAKKSTTTTTEKKAPKAAKPKAGAAN